MGCRAGGAPRGSRAVVRSAPKSGNADCSHEGAGVRGELGGFVGWEAEAGEALAAPVVHGLLELLDAGVTAGDGLMCPAAGGEQDQRVEDLGVESAVSTRLSWRRSIAV